MITNRVLDKRIAKKIGYHSGPVYKSDDYILLKPHKRKAKGLGAIWGNGPAQNIITSSAHRPAFIGSTEKEVWDWVPYFSSNSHHNNILREHLECIHAIHLPDPSLSPREAVLYYLERLEGQPSVSVKSVPT